MPRVYSLLAWFRVTAMCTPVEMACTKSHKPARVTTMPTASSVVVSLLPSELFSVFTDLPGSGEVKDSNQRRRQATRVSGVACGEQQATYTREQRECQ